MANESTLQRLQAEFDSPPQAVFAVVALLEEGANPQFIRYFRRDETGDMHEERITAIEERMHFLEDLAARKRAILEQAEQKGVADENLRQTIETCFDQELLDDIYQSFRPRRRTAGVQAREKGLGEVADAILAGDLGGKSLTEVADARIDAGQDLPTREAVLEGVLHCLAEHFAADTSIRNSFRDDLQHHGILRSAARDGAHKRRFANRYKEFFAFEKPVKRIAPQQMLNLRHAEREGLIEVSLDLPPERATAILRRHCQIATENDPILGEFLGLVFEHSFDSLIRPACENDVRHRIKERADREAVRGLVRNLRSQLLSPPLGGKRVLGLRASKKACWLAVAEPDNSLGESVVLHMEQPEQRQESLAKLTALIIEQQPFAVALPHGRHYEASSQLLNEALAGLTADNVEPMVIAVDEAASAIHATSPAGRKELAKLDVGIRTAFSLARRLQDPMAELLGLDPKSLGLGHNLEEVHQGILSRYLDQAITACVAAVGADPNKVAAEHLCRVPGFDRELARRVIEDRDANGPFSSLDALRQRLQIPDQRFRDAAGFLRLSSSENPLDATAVHPDDYPIAAALADGLGVPQAELLGNARLRGLRTEEARANCAQVVKDAPELRLRDVIRSLAFFGSDPRGELRPVSNAGIRDLKDLTTDRELQGRITNLTEFGAFVDLGIGQDGLIHISQIPPHRLRDPSRMLAVGEVVTIYVLKVDTETKRISLSMHKPRHLQEGRRPTIGERLGQLGHRRRGPQNEPQIQSRAARAPDRGGRRGSGPRRGPRPEHEGGGDFRGGSRDRGPRRDGATPKVVTIESDKEHPATLGHKGELRSLASLAALLGKSAAPKPDATPVEPRSVGPSESTGTE